jgi:MFS family permease
MLLQAAAIVAVAALDSFSAWLSAVCLLGVGTALAYPTLLAAIGDVVHPRERATFLGVYRFWRDTGAVVGALSAGAVADVANLRLAIVLVAAVTLASGLLAQVTMQGPATLGKARV